MIRITPSAGFIVMTKLGNLGNLFRAGQKHFASKAVILMYHRVTTSDLDPWSQCVTPERFEQHMDFLKRASHPVSLRQLTEYRQHGSFPPRTVALTFDDGYADNLHDALPVLARYDIPATFFIASGAIGANREFWWDELERLLLRPKLLPDRLEIALADTTQTWDLGDATTLTDLDRRLFMEAAPWEAPLDSRYGFFYRTWQFLQPLAEPDRVSALTQMREWLGLSDSTTMRPTHRVLDAEELELLAHGEGVEIGAHTVTHAALSSKPRDEQLVEIDRSKRDLEKRLHISVSSFAYPYGDYGSGTRQIVSEVGFERACSTEQDSVWKRSDPLTLPRMQVGDWDQEEFAERLARSDA